MRKKRARRFSPRYGVTQLAIEEEAKELHREMEDYLIQSQAELDKTLKERHKSWTEADATVEYLVRQLPDRERSVIQCLLVRDMYQLLELYRQHLNSLTQDPSLTRPITAVDDDERLTPFSEWLFPA